MNEMNISKIGEVSQAEDGFSIKLKKEFRTGLTAIDGFSHLDIIWWADRLNPEFRNQLIIDKPYKKGPEKIGVFATRAEYRPNPIAVSTVYVIKIDHDNGIIYTPYIDAFPGTAVLDIKPYHPSTNITKSVSVPKWCSHWPSSMEDSASFDWEAEFNF